MIMGSLNSEICVRPRLRLLRQEEAAYSSVEVPEPAATDVGRRGPLDSDSKSKSLIVSARFQQPINTLSLFRSSHNPSPDMAPSPALPVPNRDSSLLSPTTYDTDASSLHSDQESDSDDDAVLHGARTSTEIRDHDRGVLLEEEEREEMIRRNSVKPGGLRRKSSFNLLGDGVKETIGSMRGVFDRVRRGSDVAIADGIDDGPSEKGRGRRDRRRERRKRKRERLSTEAKQGEDGHLMYEMEEGGLKDGSDTGESSEMEDSAEIDRKGLLHLRDDKATKKRKWRKWLFIHVLVGLLFAILAMSSWRLSMGRKSNKEQKLFNNGTALFAPTTILISLDGFRADFLQRGLTPRLNAFVAEGVSPSWMLPSFPSVTFPNHYTLVTGLYPEAHGVVGNSFWDPKMQEEFFYTDPSHSMQGKWWGGEPLWVTAEKQGIRTAIHMWPGSEAHIMDVEPSFLDEFNGKEILSNKVERVLQLIDMPGLEADVPVAEMRPQLIAAYIPNVDSDGHKFGPNSTEIKTTINNVDKMLDDLFTGLEARNLTKVVNVVVVSDHGMATTSTDRLIQLDDVIDMDKIEHVDGWPLYGLRPKDDGDLRPLYDVLVKEAAKNPGFEVYLRDENMPERWHFSKNDRIAPLWIIPKTGWAIVTKAEFNVEEEKAKGGVFHPRGLHGYDHENPLMRAIFIARGPAFPHPPNSRINVFQNIEVYNIVCDSLGLEPRPNNGTLRLPLSPVGLHDSTTVATDPDDLPASATSDELVDPEVNSVISISPIEASSAADPNVVPPHLVGVNPPDDPGDEDPDVDYSPPIMPPDNSDSEGNHESGAGGEAEEPKSKGKESWWDYLTGQIDDLKSWANGIIEGIKGGGS